MAVEEVSAEELAGLDLDLDDPSLQVDAAPVEDVALTLDASQSGEAPVESEAAVEDGLGFEEDAGITQTVDPYAEVASETAEQEWYLAAKAGEGAADGEEEEYEEEEQENPDEPVADEAAEEAPIADEAAEEAASEDGDDSIMFFEDTVRVAEPTAPKAVDVQLPVSGSSDDAAEQVGGVMVLCANCGLPGHATTACPFGHPEDIQLGDMDESDSDDELPEMYPLFARFVSQHTGALVPKKNKGLTGDKRYFGDDKPHKQCWVCGAEDHESNECKFKRCFFCGEPGHDSRTCTEKSKICGHCRCKGHLPTACPTLASQGILSFATTHCMRCGAVGHPQCRPPPPQMQNQIPMVSMGQPMQAPQFFHMGLPPPTPYSPPPSPMGGDSSPGMFKAMSKASFKAVSGWGGESTAMSEPGMSKATASMSFLNGGSVPGKAMGVPSAFKSPGKAAMGKGMGKMSTMPANLHLPGEAPMSKIGAPISKAPISKVPGKASITKVAGKGPIVKVPGKAPITKVIPKLPGQNLLPATFEKPMIMKASAKRASVGGASSPKRARSNGW